MWTRALSLFFVSCLVSELCVGQTPNQQPIPTIRTTTREVVLDVIVRDKHHRAIADVRPDEIEVYEDGVRQKINAFRNVQGTEQLQTEEALAKTRGGAQGQTKEPANTLRELNFVSVVFAQIAPLNLEFAREAVVDFLRSDSLPNTYVTIYRLDRSLELIQPYTSNKAMLLAAVDRAAKGAHNVGYLSSSAITAGAINTNIQATATNIIASPLTSPQEAQAVQNAMLDPLSGIVTDPLWARNAASEDASLAVTNALVTQAQTANGLRFAESLSNGMDTLQALRHLVRMQEKLPGRKVVLYLADGLSLPMDRRDVVNSVISYANQMEVAFYALDTRGLSVDDPVSQSLADQERAGAESSVNNASPQMGHMEGDDIDLASSSDKELAMEELAESTGGFAVTNTNEIAVPMQRVMEDIRTHYELAYTPSSTVYDGHFRRIQVRINRPKVTVQTRSGYFAVPDINGEPLQPFEVKALHAINEHPSAMAFPYQAALLRFRPKTSGGEYEMAFDIPVTSLRVVTDKESGRARIRLSVVALIHKSDGEVVGKVSRDLVRDAPKTELAHLGDDHVVYSEPVELPGGHYFIDTAVTDELAGKSSVKRISEFVDSGRDFGVSSLELVREVKPLSGPWNSQDPFETESGRIVPTLSESVPSGKPVDVYFVVYPPTGSEVPPMITLQLFRDGREIGSKKLASPLRQADGSMPMLMRIHPDPGQCDMVITAHQGTMASQATLSLKITPNGAVNQD